RDPGARDRQPAQRVAARPAHRGAEPQWPAWRGVAGVPGSAPGVEHAARAGPAAGYRAAAPGGAQPRAARDDRVHAVPAGRHARARMTVAQPWLAAAALVGSGLTAGVLF